MKICVPNLNKEGFGGGWTFLSNFRRALEALGHQFVDRDQMGEADVMFVGNPMWAERSDFEEAKRLGKRVVLRLDNIPEDFNNRGTAISKLRDFIGLSDYLIYQSRWSYEKYREVFDVKEKESSIIYNGVDTKMFSPDRPKLPGIAEVSPVVLYVKSSRNENKRYPEAMEIWRRWWASEKKGVLLLVGKFADDFHRYNFGFYNGERYQYCGALDLDGMAMLYASSDVLLFPAYADAAPNVVLEAMASECTPIIHPYGGGIEFLGPLQSYGELIHQEPVEEVNYVRLIEDALSHDKQAARQHVKENFSLDKMAKEYLATFNV